MKANELRNGNLIHRLGNESVVNWSTIKLCEQRNKQFNGDWKPIPLTPEWLERFGFRHEQIYDAIRCYRTDHFALTYHVNEPNNMYLHGYGIDSNPVLFVHQLQNLYFALTGKELELKQ